jgi:hypothetical protein
MPIKAASPGVECDMSWVRAMLSLAKQISCRLSINFQWDYQIVSMLCQ